MFAHSPSPDRSGAEPAVLSAASRRGYPDVADVIEQMILRAFNLPVRTLRSPSRGPATIAFARQVAIYIAHVEFGMTLTAASSLFGRDRTTGAHACRLVEDRRDDRKIDATIEAIERAIIKWRFPGRPRSSGRDERGELLQ